MLNDLKGFQTVDLNRFRLVIGCMRMVEKVELVQTGRGIFRRYTTSIGLKKIKLLIMKCDGNFYEPCCSSSKKWVCYKDDPANLKKDEIFVSILNRAPIQHTIYGEKFLTDEEKITGKITIARIKEIEELLNNLARAECEKGIEYNSQLFQ